MPQESIFAPLGAMALLTFVVLTLIPVARFRALGARAVTPDDFKFGESSAVPGDVSVPNRNYMNLLELPLLLYVGGLMYYVAGRTDETAVLLAWTYVGLRAAHSAIHLTYNNVLHRLIPFALSNFVLMAFWLLFFV